MPAALTLDLLGGLRGFDGVGMSAVPRAERFVDAAVRVFRGLFACKFGLHAFHTSAKALAASSVFFGFGVRGRWFQPRFALGLGFRVVRRAPLGV